MHKTFLKPYATSNSLFSKIYAPKKAIHNYWFVDVTELQNVAAEPFKFHLGGFALGFLLGLLGVIITLFFKDANKQNRLYSSLIGLGAVIILVLLLCPLYVDKYSGRRKLRPFFCTFPENFNYEKNFFLSFSFKRLLSISCTG
jgi:hypothetical protein